MDPESMFGLGAGSGGTDTPVTGDFTFEDFMRALGAQSPPPPDSSPTLTSSDFLPGMGGPSPDSTARNRPSGGGGMAQVAGQQSGSDTPAPRPPTPPSWSLGHGHSVPPPQSLGGTRSPQAMQMLSQLSSNKGGGKGLQNLMSLAEIAAALYTFGAF